MKKLAILFVVVCTTLFANATVRRVNNNIGVVAVPGFVFTNASSALQDAVNAAVAGDTIYIEGSVTAYNNANCNKRLVFIGTGYLLKNVSASELGNNPAAAPIQANIEEATVNSLTFTDTAASGSKISGLRVAVYLNPRADDITIERCRLTNLYMNVAATNPGQVINNLKINKCLFDYSTMYAYVYYMTNLEITNCICQNLYFSPYQNSTQLQSALVRNNVFRNGGMYLSNCLISNNIFVSGTGGTSIVASNFKNNLSNTAADLPVGNGNQNSVTMANVFLLVPTVNSYDGQWQLKAGSPAIAAGETIGAITPDCGAFGTADPYRLSGIPAIPTIYEFSSPASIPTGATSMTITVKTRSNN
jgi:hypothetical protein